MLNGLLWALLAAFVALIVGTSWYGRRKLAALRRAEEDRFAAFMSAATGRSRPAATDEAPASAAPAASPPSPGGGAQQGLLQQKLLFDAAHKAGEAGEPALALQLYERLLERYPDTGFAELARAAAEAQRKKLAKG